MPHPLVAVALELDFPTSRRLGVLAGIQRMVDEQGSWNIRVGEKIVFEPAGRLVRYAAVITRDSTDLLPVNDDRVRSILRYIEGNLGKPLTQAALWAGKS